MSTVLFARQRVSGGKERGETSLSVKPLKGDTASVERIAASVLLSFSHRRTQMQTHIVSFSPRDVLCERRSLRWAWVIELQVVYSGLHVFI
ncbi:hypothetical protein ABVT39_006090 [Epinephelus coioides]